MKRHEGARTELRRRAFTLVELLVVMAILLIVMLLMLPAILRTIEGADRSRCAVNQAKLALGMASYDTRNGFFPGIRNDLNIKSPASSPNVILRDYGGALLPSGRFPMPKSTTNWFVMILPYTGFAPVFDMVVDGQVWIGNGGDFPISHPGIAQDISACPARGGFYDVSDGHAGKNTHYAANGAGNSTAAGSFNRNDGAIGDNSNGVFVSMADVVKADGSSTTFLISERDVGGGGVGLDKTWMPYTWSNSGPVSDNRVPAGVTTYGDFRTVGGDHGSRKVHPDANGTLGGALLFGFDSSASVISTTTRVINTGNGRLPGSGPSTAGAQHPGGVYVAFVDGSTRFIKDDLAPHVYGHLVTHRSLWNGSSYSTNSVRANAYLNALPTTTPPTTNPYQFKTGDY